VSARGEGEPTWDGVTNAYPNVSTSELSHNRFDSPDVTVNQPSRRREVSITVSKLSALQQFILKAAYSNKINKAMLSAPYSTWIKRPWRDLTDEKVALLYYNIGAYRPARMETTTPTQIGPFTFPGEPAGFFREVFNRDIPRKDKAVARAAISRAMKRLAHLLQFEKLGCCR
jgi:hypothetical protein